VPLGTIQAVVQPQEHENAEVLHPHLIGRRTQGSLHCWAPIRFSLPHHGLPVRRSVGPDFVGFFVGKYKMPDLGIL